LKTDENLGTNTTIVLRKYQNPSRTKLGRKCGGRLEGSWIFLSMYYFSMLLLWGLKTPFLLIAGGGLIEGIEGERLLFSGSFLSCYLYGPWRVLPSLRNIFRFV
jgi:hypothetical protein